MKKIVIIGALGYLGTELCRIYSGESWKNKIIAIDNRFLSERVSQLNKWNIEFFQGHILDNDFLKKHIFDADIVHHLAGVTDVAYVKTEANSELDEKIRSIAIDGTNNVLNNISNSCKIIFPSTHVVFEGLDRVKKDIKENEVPKPVLMYSSSKVQNEIDIKKSNLNYIILRLGSVYGYSLDTMRINIMPNLFSKITSQNGTIKLFADGKQLKSLVNIIDVARCMKFMEENDKINKETFHLVNEQLSVKDVANLCKEINPKVNLINSNNETPNLGYTLSNKKLLKTGFKFLYNIENSLKEMINQWSFSNDNNGLEHIHKGKNEYVDKRGSIINYELPEPINLVGYIDSKKGTFRANHYHPIQEQKCLLVKGQFISIYKDLISNKSQKITHVVNEGDLIVTKPNVAHAMVFTKNSIFLNLVRGEREHKNYGVTHTLPYKLIENNEVNRLLKYYKLECRCCGSKDLRRILSLGFQPLANNLIKKINKKIETFPLELNYCTKCFNVQLSTAIDSKKMFKNYLYLSSTSNKFKKHFNKATLNYIKNFKLRKSSFIIDVGSNDGIGLVPFKEKGFSNLLGIEPAKNLCKLTKKKGIKVINSFLNKNCVKKIKKKADLILASNVFAHSDNLELMAKCMMDLLSKNGTLIIEVQYLLNTINDLSFDNIYHEHYNYWSLTSLDYFFKKLNGNLFKAEKIDTHGGSIRIYLSKDLNKKKDISVNKILKEEKKFGIHKFETFENYATKVKNLKKNVQINISRLNKKFKTIVGYGSPAKATTALNYYGIEKEIKFILEDNKLKHGKYVPGVNIPIYSKDKLKDKSSLVIVLAWNFFDDIKRNNKSLGNKIISIKDLQDLNISVNTHEIN